MCAIVCGVWLFAFVCFQTCFNEFEFADLTLSCVSSKQFGSLSFATMCGLVVPIALAHACCALSLLAQVAAAQIVPAQFKFLGWWWAIHVESLHKALGL